MSSFGQQHEDGMDKVTFSRLRLFQQTGEIQLERVRQFQQTVEGRVRFQGFDMPKTGATDPGHFSESLLGKLLLNPCLCQGLADLLDDTSLLVGFHP